jgi:hypothetical protein
MYAMELNGSHVGRLVKLSWITAGGKPAVTTRKISKLTHWPAGEVSVNTGADPFRFPADAAVEFV